MDTKPNGPNKPNKFLINFPTPLLEQVQEYQRSEYISSRNEAIKRLVTRALKTLDLHL